MRAIGRSTSLRKALLGAAAFAALAGGVAEGAFAVAATSDGGIIAPQAAAGPASFADIVDRVTPAVVSVKVKIVDADPGDDEDSNGLPDFSPDSPFYRFFRRFGLPHDDAIPRRRSSMAQGSGFFISADGYIVTNNHVVDHASEVTVTLSGGNTLPAKVIGVDKKTDLAFLKAQGDGFSLRGVRVEAAAGRRLGDRGRQSLRPRWHGHGRHRLGSRPGYRLRSRTTTSCRSTPR